MAKNSVISWWEDFCGWWWRCKKMLEKKVLMTSALRLFCIWIHNNSIYIFVQDSWFMVAQFSDTFQDFCTFFCIISKMHWAEKATKATKVLAFPKVLLLRLLTIPAFRRCILLSPFCCIRTIKRIKKASCINGKKQ